ncbi:hypothetical protein [Mesorhizobium sp. M4B.F.Ca.ET.058.02.1.1]|uniref:hypothetical protein n=1 Tax=Mesorhizobium sp. M4B.F.Ca.ET.058.02.1.1 TaxID=2493675 RepID=UPI000F758AD8|nr:hypothetical protein [Mesorhizobium sp. M4B.F.Ca.ET.058.02.1.1]AZO48076.1 hypothetical protein EJ073_09785 [Mesorhizobium sp. M4B.F.Ca.ET.058.02.1.1]TJX71216.1 MAG: hypothetical protein E5W21_07725 [Mesorhizobium sp.]
MKISELINTLQQIQVTYGDIAITGGAMLDDVPLSQVSVTDVEGMEVWPHDPNGVAGKHKIDGVFFQ